MYLFTSRIGCTVRYEIKHKKATPALLVIPAKEDTEQIHLSDYIVTAFTLSLANNLIVTISMLNKTNVYPKGDNPGNLNIAGILLLHSDKNWQLTQFKNVLHYVEEKKKPILIAVGDDLKVNFVPRTVVIAANETLPAFQVSINGFVLPEERVSKVKST